MGKSLYKHKALERLQTSKWCLSQGYLSSCASNLYFAYFNYFQYVVGSPSKGRWRHIGIVKAFVLTAFRALSFSPEELRRIKKAYDDLYGYRLRADYSPEEIPPTAESILGEYIDLLSEVIRHES